MSKPILQPFSQISTGIRCANCCLSIVQVAWKRCGICEKFDLCEECIKLSYDQLELPARKYHKELHQKINDNNPISNEQMVSILFENISEDAEGTADELSDIIEEQKIENDNDLSAVMAQLKKMNNQLLSQSAQDMKQDLCSMIVDYHMRAYDTKIHVLCLDGGGVRGYMPIKVIHQLILEKHLPDIKEFQPENIEHRKQFDKAQSYFTSQFDYFAGTSTGGLIAFCLAVGYDILKMKEIYERASYYFNRNRLGPLFWAKYDPSRIHQKIDEIINTVQLKDGKQLTAENATLLDIHNFLNPTAVVSEDVFKSTLVRHGNLLEFVDDEDEAPRSAYKCSQFNRVKREKVLLITAYNATKDSIMVFNTSYAKHWGYRIADVLKATMAAPTYFPPQAISRGVVEKGLFIPKQKTPEIFVDGGVFANDPSLIALWAMRMQWKKLFYCHMLSIGTGDYNTPITSSNLGGYFGWLINGGLLVNTLMDATRSLTEVVAGNLAKFKNMKRMKFNYRLREAMSLDDAAFVNKFDNEWEALKNGQDFRTLIYFYGKYIVKEHN